MVLHVSQKVKIILLDVFIYPPFTELKNIMGKLLLRGSLIDSRTQLFSRVALIKLVMAKRHSTVKARVNAETKKTVEKKWNKYNLIFKRLFCTNNKISRLQRRLSKYQSFLSLLL